MRSDASTNAGVTSILPADTLLIITGGPVEADGFTWWQVRSGNTRGWVAEGNGTEAWIVHILDT
ncbi:MAG: SH3 domain-containing protein, partial [Chloroflexota bacterium]